VTGHLLGDFQLAAVLEVLGDAGGAEGVVAEFGENGRSCRWRASSYVSCLSRPRSRLLTVSRWRGGVSRAEGIFVPRHGIRTDRGECRLQ
jgi:hypothetical protein